MNSPISTNQEISVVRVILAVLLPPVAVAMQVGITAHFWLNLVLTILGWVPGMIHGLFMVLTNADNKPSMDIPDDMDVRVRTSA